MSNAIGRVIGDLLNNNQAAEGSTYICSICNGTVAPYEVVIEGLGISRWVQPKCPCEVREMEKKMEQMKNVEREREVRNLFSVSDIGERYLTATFDNFAARPGSEKAFKIAKYYAENMDRFGKDCIMLWGEPGNGKTHLAAAVHNYLKEQGKVIVFVSMPDLLAKIRSTFNKANKESEEQILKALQTCDLLIIDDLGAEKTTDWVEETLFKIVDARYRKNKPIMATSNVSPSEIPTKLGKRTNDRIVEMMNTTKNEASSYRLERATKRFEKFNEFLNE